jgi:hypothetical protein
VADLLHVLLGAALAVDEALHVAAAESDGLHPLEHDGLLVGGGQ